MADAKATQAKFAIAFVNTLQMFVKETKNRYVKPVGCTVSTLLLRMLRDDDVVFVQIFALYISPYKLRARSDR